jgi:HEAT repeats
MGITTQWEKIREGLQSSDTEEVRQAVVKAGKIEVGEIPDDVVHAMVPLFGHTDPRLRVAAVRTLGLHWHLAAVAQAAGDLVSSDADWHVRLSAISALGSIGRRHSSVRRRVSKALANVVVGEQYEDDERMLASVELLFVEGKIGISEYVELDHNLPKSFGDFKIDRPWVERLAKSD